VASKRQSGKKKKAKTQGSLLGLAVGGIQKNRESGQTSGSKPARSKKGTFIEVKKLGRVEEWG